MKNTARRNKPWPSPKLNEERNENQPLVVSDPIRKPVIIRKLQPGTPINNQITYDLII